VQPGWSANDANFDMPEVEVPFSGGFTPSGGWVDTNYYDYILNSGDYKLSQLKGAVLVAGNARILVTDKIEFSEDPKDDHGIAMDPGASIEIYMAGKEAKIRGKKDKKIKKKTKKGVDYTNTTAFYINGLGNPTNFFYYGLKKNNKVELKNLDDFTGIIYAPSAEIKIKAGSTKYYHCNIHGAVMGKKVKLEKNVSFHFDENIGNLPADSFVVESWEEL